MGRIYGHEIQFNKAKATDIEAPFLELLLSILIGFVLWKIYDNRNDFDFEMINFPFLDEGIPRFTSYGVYISQLIRFARVTNHVYNVNTLNKILSAELH